MKSGTSLIRIQRFRVQEVQRQVVDLERVLEEFRNEQRELDQRVRLEQEKAGISDETHYAYPTYAKYAAKRRDNLSSSIADLERQVAVERERLAAAFEELKKAELVDAAGRARLAARRRRREQADLDEIGIGMHRSRAAE